MNEQSVIDDSEANPIKELNLDEALQLAIYLQQKSRHEEAVELFGRILEVVPEHVDALHYCGLSDYFLGNAEKGIKRI